MEKSIFKIGKTLLISLFLLMSLSVCSQNVGINTSGTNPDANAILDLNTGNSGNLGFLVPNVTLGTTLTAFWTGSVPAGPMANLPTAGDAGLMVYNSVATNQPIGYYYWNGATWVSFSGGAGTVTAADDGTSLNGTTVILGNAISTIGGQLTQNTEIPLNNKYISFSAAGTSTTPGQIGVDLTAGTAPASSLDVNGSFGNGVTDLSPAAASTTTLTNLYSTVISTPPAIASSYTLALPSAIINTRRIYTIVYNGNSLGTIDITSPTAGNIVVYGAAVSPLSLSSGAITLQSDGTNWDVTSANGPSIITPPYFQTGSIAYVTAGNYSWTVPAGILQVEVFLMGAGGGGNGSTNNTGSYEGGSGGFVQGILSVTPGEVLYLVVGTGGTGVASGTTGLGGGGGGSYIQQTSAAGTLLCGAGGGGGAAGSSYYETIGGTNYVGTGYGGGGWYGTTIAQLAGGSGVATVGAGDGSGGADYTGYLTNIQAWKGTGQTSNPTSGKTYGNDWVDGMPPALWTALYAATTNGSALTNSGISTNVSPMAGMGSEAASSAGTAGEIVIRW